MDVLNALQEGRAVANPATWKDHQKTFSAVLSLLGLAVFMAQSLGVKLPLTNDQILTWSLLITAVLGVVNYVLTVITTDKVGWALKCRGPLVLALLLVPLLTGSCTARYIHTTGPTALDSCDAGDMDIFMKSDSDATKACGGEAITVKAAPTENAAGLGAAAAGVVEAAAKLKAVLP